VEKQEAAAAPKIQQSGNLTVCGGLVLFFNLSIATIKKSWF